MKREGDEYILTFNDDHIIEPMPCWAKALWAGAIAVFFYLAYNCWTMVC